MPTRWWQGRVWAQGWPGARVPSVLCPHSCGRGFAGCWLPGFRPLLKRRDCGSWRVPDSSRVLAVDGPLSEHPATLSSGAAEAGRGSGVPPRKGWTFHPESPCPGAGLLSYLGRHPYLDYLDASEPPLHPLGVGHLGLGHLHPQAPGVGHPGPRTVEPLQDVTGPPFRRDGR